MEGVRAFNSLTVTPEKNLLGSVHQSSNHFKNTKIGTGKYGIQIPVSHGLDNFGDELKIHTVTTSTAKPEPIFWLVEAESRSRLFKAAPASFFRQAKKPTGSSCV